MEDFKTDRPISYVIWPLIILQCLVGLVVFNLLKMSPSMDGIHPFVLPLSILCFLIMAFWSWILGTHPPYFVKITKYGLLAIKLSGSRIPWKEILRIERELGPEGTPGMNFYIRDKDGRTKKTFFRLDGYEASPEDIWAGVKNGFDKYKHAKS